MTIHSYSKQFRKMEINDSNHAVLFCMMKFNFCFSENIHNDAKMFHQIFTSCSLKQKLHSNLHLHCSNTGMNVVKLFNLTYFEKPHVLLPMEQARRATEFAVKFVDRTKRRLQ